MEGFTLEGARVARVVNYVRTYQEPMESVVPSTCNVVFVKNAEPSSELQQLERFFAMFIVVLGKHANSHFEMEPVGWISSRCNIILVKHAGA